MENTISKRSPVKALAAKTSGNPLPGNKTLGIESLIRLYELESSDKTEEGEETEIIINHDKSLTECKKNLVKRTFPQIKRPIMMDP